MKNLQKSILAVLSVFTLTSMIAQTTPEVEFKTNTVDTPIEEVTYEYLLAHRVHLRDNPSLKSKRIDVLNIGTRLALWEKSENQDELKGVKSHWYRVTTGNAHGWIWGGMIAQKTVGSQADHDVKFAYGFESATVNEEGVLEEKHQLRAFRNGREIDKIVFDGNTTIAMEVKNIGSKGLINIDDILTFDIPDEKNQNSLGQLYIFWNNGKFQNVASLIDYSDTAYSKSEAFVFPSDMEGLKNTIILETTITNHNTASEANAESGTKKLIVSFYEWDGHKLVQKESLPPISKDLAFNTNE